MCADAIRLGVAGLGRIGWGFHAKTAAEGDAFELVAVADTEPDRRREAARALKTEAFADFSRMLRRAGLEAVVIATPTHLHRDMAVEALEQGLHVILEKPMACNLGEAEEIEEAAARSGRVLTVYQPHRLGAYFQHLVCIVRSGRIGAVTWAQRGMFRYVRRDDWQSLRRFGGGMLNNYGAHGLDQLLQLVGYEVRQVFCALQRVASLGDAEDVVKVAFQAAGGAVGQLDIHQASALAPYELTVWGTRGSVQYREGSFRVCWFDPGTLPPKELDAALASAGRRYPQDEVQWREETVPVDDSLGIGLYEDFARALRRGTEPAVPVRETVAVMKLIERCRRKAGGVRNTE